MGMYLISYIIIDVDCADTPFSEGVSVWNLFHDYGFQHEKDFRFFSSLVSFENARAPLYDKKGIPDNFPYVVKEGLNFCGNASYLTRKELLASIAHHELSLAELTSSVSLVVSLLQKAEEIYGVDRAVFAFGLQ